MGKMLQLAYAVFNNLMSFSERLPFLRTSKELIIEGKNPRAKPSRLAPVCTSDLPEISLDILEKQHEQAEKLKKAREQGEDMEGRGFKYRRK